jgi:hypothetical protein
MPARRALDREVLHQRRRSRPIVPDTTPRSQYPRTSGDLAGDIAKALGGAKRQANGGWMARCCCHEDHDASLSLRDGDYSTLVHCFAGCDPLDVLRELRRRGLLDDKPRDEQPRRTSKPTPPIDTRAKIERLLGRCRPIAGTVVERYLCDHRGVDLPPAQDALLYLPPRPPHYPHPAMVAVVTDLADARRIMTVQFTLLRSDGMGKASYARRFLGDCPARGGVVRLVDDAEVTDRLELAEGVESALAVMSGFARSSYAVPPVWAALSAGNLVRLPVLPGVKALRIFSDNDPNGVGQGAALELGRTWRKAGREAFITTRSAGGDWNDAT